MVTVLSLGHIYEPVWRMGIRLVKIGIEKELILTHVCLPLTYTKNLANLNPYSHKR